jgi:pimeloyl-ACP methyl ester carboxylesterase
MTETKNEPGSASPLRGQRSVILIVHGVGQQPRYETSAGFAAGLQRNLEARHGGPLRTERILQRHGDGEDSLLRVHGGPRCTVDVVEYYYQPALQRQTQVVDVIEWLLTTVGRIRKIYRALKKGGWKPPKGPDERIDLELGYGLTPKGMWLATLLIKAVGFLLPALRSLPSRLSAIPLLGILGPLATPVVRGLAWWLATFVSNRLDALIVDYAGDVTAYTAIDPRLRLSDVRSKILSGCQAKIDGLLDVKAPGGEQAFYDQVIVAGHSLGSVVAYDALSRVNAEMIAGLGAGNDPDRIRQRAGRLRGLVTFGSPLDKVAFMFWPQSEEQIDRMLNERTGSATDDGVEAEWRDRRANLLAGMLEHYHGLRGADMGLPGRKSDVVQPQVEPLGHVTWLNFYHPEDIIAGRLDAFENVKNLRTSNELARGQDPHDHTPGFPAAHSYYWWDPRMHQFVISRFLEESSPEDLERVRVL